MRAKVSRSPAEERAPDGYLGRAGTAVYEKGQKRLQGILHHAEQVLAEQGYAKFSMRRVATESGISLAALQHYFPTLQQLIGALFRHVVDRYKAEMLEVPGMDDPSPLARLDALAGYFLVMLRTPHSRRLFAELWAMSLRDEQVAETMDEVTEQYAGGFFRILAELNPTLSPARRRRRAVMIIAQIDGLSGYILPESETSAETRALERDARQHIRALALLP